MAHDGVEPVAVVAQGFFDDAEDGFEGAVEFVGGGSIFGEVIGELAHGFEEAVEVLRFANALGCDVAHVVECIGSVGAGVGAVGCAKFLADLFAQAIAEDRREDVESAEFGLIPTQAFGFPDRDRDGLRNFCVVGKGLAGRRFRKIDVAQFFDVIGQ